MNLKFNVDDQKIITGLDLGSKTMKCMMGVMRDQKFELLGCAEVEHNGIQNQQIVDARATTDAIRRVCQEVEIISERQITDLWVALSNSFHVVASEGMSIITGGQVTQRHIRQAIATARAVPVSDHQEVVHIFPASFQVDKKDPVFNPMGLSGLRLETSVLLVTCELSTIYDLQRCLSQAGHSSRGFVVQSVAAGLSVASAEDKKRGVCVVDIGRYCTQVCVFYGGRIVYLSQIPFGVEDWTSDLISQLKISPTMAEKIKYQYGVPLKEEKSFCNGEIPVSCEQYHDSLVRSLENGFFQIKNELEQKKIIHQIGSGLILTGGGSLLKNIEQWAKHYFEKPVRIGTSHLATTSNGSSILPQYNVAAGLLSYAKEDRLDFKEPSRRHHTKIQGWFKDLISS